MSQPPNEVQPNQLADDLPENVRGALAALRRAALRVRLVADGKLTLSPVAGRRMNCNAQRGR